MTYSLLVALNLLAATGVDRQKFTNAFANKHALNSTTYALLLDVPGTGNVTYKRTSVRPWLKPAILKKPATQTGGDLLWADVPMPLVREQELHAHLQGKEPRRGKRKKGAKKVKVRGSPFIAY